ncbi:MAG: N(4)-(beta-N-acetylglucosaminyl)-L-asparaginase [Dehalococcoidia bacterium]
MIVVASSNGRVGIAESIRVLKAGGSALDAVEAGIRLVEDNFEDTSVGTGGLPNILGEVELDASIMDGSTRRTGAVAALKGYPNPISVARKVMDELPHVLLAGDGAARFAGEMGFAQADLLTQQSKDRYQQWLLRVLPDNASPSMIAYREQMHHWVKATADAAKSAGTVDFIAQDRRGNIACGVSTSGWPWKYPGRVGDSPIIGAGNYCDNRYGAAACTGHGEMAIRGSTARSVLLYLKLGKTLEEALTEAMNDLWEMNDPAYGGMNIVAIDRAGRPLAVASGSATFIYQTDEMEQYVEEPRLIVKQN